MFTNTYIRLLLNLFTTTSTNFMKKTLIILFLFVSLSGFSQDNKNTQKEIVKTYSTELKLNTLQSEKLASILSAYKEKLYNKNLSRNQFNATLKLQTLEIYELLSKDQFSSYLKLRAKYQPELSYRFN